MNATCIPDGTREGPSPHHHIPYSLSDQQDCAYRERERDPSHNSQSSVSSNTGAPNATYHNHRKSNPSRLSPFWKSVGTESSSIQL